MTYGLFTERDHIKQAYSVLWRIFTQLQLAWDVLDNCALPFLWWMANVSNLGQRVNERVLQKLRKFSARNEIRHEKFNVDMGL